VSLQIICFIIVLTGFWDRKLEIDGFSVMAFQWLVTNRSSVIYSNSLW